jgi:hypothetical protein
VGPTDSIVESYRSNGWFKKKKKKENASTKIK